MPRLPPISLQPRASPEVPATGEETGTDHPVSRAEPLVRVSYKVSQAARVTGLSRGAIYQAIRRGDLQVFEPIPGGDWVILAADLREWLTRRRVSPRVVR